LAISDDGTGIVGELWTALISLLITADQVTEGLVAHGMRKIADTHRGKYAKYAHVGYREGAEMIERLRPQFNDWEAEYDAAHEAGLIR
jgi:hypothetical protein